ncbi:MAG: hypothetical protein KGK18_02500, partial [Burkholderiales bacterium]|nr:hypothetical protein [Burkholderiales bacterium]
MNTHYAESASCIADRVLRRVVTGRSLPQGRRVVAGCGARRHQAARRRRHAALPSTFIGTTDDKPLKHASGRPKTCQRLPGHRFRAGEPRRTRPLKSDLFDDIHHEPERARR